MDTITTILPLCRLTDIPDGGATAVDALLADGAQSLILLRDGGQVRGYRNVCPHAGRRLDYAPGKFLLKDDTLICAVHGASFQRQAGVCVAGPCRGDSLRAVALRVEGDEVWLA
ncbi:Rieske (2Fe-2S) protein [Rhodanobacter ginsenosidimutans]|uniref:Rieske (2Fe-2S) protein n=1 Tax=Rhodanobacter ginsenosidimutans TaxID=490571 RepID=A0ABW0JXX0_9GAMM